VGGTEQPAPEGDGLAGVEVNTPMKENTPRTMGSCVCSSFTPRKRVTSWEVEVNLQLANLHSFQG